MTWFVAAIFFVAIWPAWSADVVLFNQQEVNPVRLLAKFKDVAEAPQPNARSTTSHAPDRTGMALAAMPELAKVSGFSQFENVVILEFKEAPGSARAQIPRPGSNVTPAPPPDVTAEIKARIEALMETGLYEYVEPDYRVTVNTTPNDQAFVNGLLWGLRNTGQSGGTAAADIRAVDAWQRTTGNRSVIVAVIDTGVDYLHPDLQANMWRNPRETRNGRDDDGNGFIDDIHGINAIRMNGDPMDDDNHGTHVAGTIGAQANGGGPHVGVAWDVQIMALKFLGPNGGFVSDAITCIDYATREGAHIMNNSWGGGGFSSALLQAITEARNAGVLFVAAAGNSGSNNDFQPSYPASYDVDNIISVAAMNRNDRRASFSNYGARSVQIGAPGEAIYSCLVGNRYGTFDGTSMAAPHVAGVAALVYANLPGNPVPLPSQENMREVRQRILNTARPVAAMAGLVSTGGMVDAAAAVGESPGAPVTRAFFSTRPSPLAAGVEGTGLITLTRQGDVQTGASVRTTFLNGQDYNFLDNGLAPDETQNDGVYSASLRAFNTPGLYPFTVTINDGTQTVQQELSVLVEEARPENDDFANARRILAGETRLTASSLLATSEPGEPGWRSGVFPRKTLWWEWTPAISGPATIDTFDSDFDTTLAIFQGAALPSLVRIISNDDAGGTWQSSVTFPAVAGEQYYIQVDGFSGASGNVVINVPSTAPGLEPPVFTRTPVSQAVATGANVSFIAEARGNPPPTYQWFRNGEPLFDDGDRISGATAGQLTILRAESSDSGSYECRATNSQGSATSLPASLVVETGVRPINDDFAEALELQPGETLEGTNILATREPNEPQHADREGNNSVWYYWAAPDEVLATIDTAGSGFNAVIAVYAGDSLAELVEVASDDGGGSSGESLVQFPTKGGQTYYIAVDGSRANSTGFIRLRLQTATTGDNEVVVPAPDTPRPLPDLQTVVSALEIFNQPTSLPIEDIALDLNISHTWRGDLVVILTSPEGHAFTISDRQGGSQSNIVIAAANLNIFAHQAPPTLNPNGRWTLSVSDRAPGDSGTLNSWGLRLSLAARDDTPIEDFPAPDVPLEIRDFQVIESRLVVRNQPSTIPLGNILIDLRVLHTWRGDLVASLTAPDGTLVTLSDRQGGSARDLLLNSQPLDSPAFRILGRSSSNTVNPNGTWTLQIEDAAAGDEGRLESWSLRIPSNASPEPTEPSEQFIPGLYLGNFGDRQLGGNQTPAQFQRGNGHLRLRLRTNGLFTGWVVFDGKRLPVRGRLDTAPPEGGGRIDKFRRISMTNLSYEKDANYSGVSGSLEEIIFGEFDLPIADFSCYAAKKPDVSLPQTARFNSLLRGAAPQVEERSYGFASTVLRRSGTVRVIGRLPDGAAFSTSSRLVMQPQSEMAPLIRILPRNRGLLLTSPVLTRDQMVDIRGRGLQFNGQLDWSRNVHFQGGRLLSNQVATLPMVGTVWAPEPGSHIFGGFGDPLRLFELSFPESFFSSPFAGVLSSRNKVTMVTPPPSRDWQIRIARSTGLIRGRIMGGNFRGLLLSEATTNDPWNDPWPLRGGGYYLQGATSALPMVLRSPP